MLACELFFHEERDRFVLFLKPHFQLTPFLLVKPRGLANRTIGSLCLEKDRSFLIQDLRLTSDSCTAYPERV
jgi:hypothetical protein